MECRPQEEQVVHAAWTRWLVPPNALASAAPIVGGHAGAERGVKAAPTASRGPPALRTADRASDVAEREQPGPRLHAPYLHGVPIILKDNLDTHDLPTSGGSLALANHRTADDAFVVRRVRDAGAVVLGKSNMHGLAAGITTISSLGGRTCNPYDPRRTPGGSSGGTGAAVAASFLDLLVRARCAETPCPAGR